MKISGKLVEIFDVVEVNTTFKKREFVVEYAENPSYPEFLKFELIQDKCELINTFSPGDTVEVHFNLKGRKWNNPKGEVVYFNSMQAWKVLALNESSKEDRRQEDSFSSPSTDLPPVEAYGNEEVPF